MPGASYGPTTSKVLPSLGKPKQNLVYQTLVGRLFGGKLPEKKDAKVEKKEKLYKHKPRTSWEAVTIEVKAMSRERKEKGKSQKK